MTAGAFISYSHADSVSLERLHKHLAVLKREGAIGTWTDHQVLSGADFGAEITAALEASGLFIALVSPDYLASQYCYEKKFERALELRKAGRMRIIPIILEDCEWQKTPLGQLKALPKDGKAVANFMNQNNAYLDVVTGIRRVLEQAVESSTAALRSPSGTHLSGTGRKPIVKQDFDAIQKSEFADSAFDTTRNYFRTSCSELNEVEDRSLKAKFEDISNTAFTCTVVNRSRNRGGERHITVQNGKQRTPFGDINYVYQRHAADGSSNGAIRVQANEYALFLTMDTLSSYGSNDKKEMTATQAAEALWLDFVKSVGIEYE